MNAPLQLRQVAQYPRQDAAIPGTVALIQMGEAGAPYASILASDFVASALAGGGRLQIDAATGAIVFGSGAGTNAGIISIASGEFLFSAPVRVSKFNANFIDAPSITVGGVPVVTAAQLAAAQAASVTSFNFRQGDVLLELPDILRAGGAPIRDAHFGGWITAPSVWDTRANDGTVATTNWVHRAIHDTGVSSFNCRTGDVTFTVADFNAAIAAAPPGVWPVAPSPVLGDASSRIATTLFVDESLDDLHLTISDEQLALLTSTYAPLNSPQFSGIPAGPTANPGTSTGQLATTAFVMAAVTASTSGVVSFNTRTGAVVLQATDISGAGGALLNSPAFVGGPTAPTAAPGTSNTVLATTAFVQAALTAVTAGVASFNGRTGAVTLTLADVTGTNVLANTALTGVPTAPTAAPGTSSTQIATTAFVAASGVSSFMSRTGAVTLTSADVSAAGGALIASPAFTGTPTAPTPLAADNSTALATTAFVKAALAATGVTTFNGRSGAVTLTLADVTGAGGAPLASPVFTGTPSAPTPSPGDSSTTLATTAFVAAALTGGGSTPGWTFSLVSNQSRMAATGTINPTFKIGAAPAGTLSFINSNGGFVTAVQDNTSNSSLTTVNYPVLKNNLTNQPAILTVAGSDTNRSIQLIPVGTGTVQSPTMAPGTNSTAIATTAFVAAGFLPLPGGTLTGPLTVNYAGVNTSITINGDTAHNKQIVFQNNSSPRWVVYEDSTAESGSNAGSFFNIGRYNDAGTFIDSPLAISRSTANVTLTGQGVNYAAYGTHTVAFNWVSPSMAVWVDNTNVGSLTPSSDYRIKKDVASLQGMWDVAKRLRPVKFTQADFKVFVADDIERWGFIAHELQEAMLPSAASGVKDGEDIQSPSPMAVIAVLAKALQEAMERIEALEAAR